MSEVTAHMPTPQVIARPRHDRSITVMRGRYNESLAHDPIAVARYYRDKLAEEPGSITDLANEIGISRSQVSNTLRLLTLPSALRIEISNGNLSSAAGRALLRLKDPATQRQIAEKVMADRLNAREIEALVRGVIAGTITVLPR